MSHGPWLIIELIGNTYLGRLNNPTFSGSESSAQERQRGSNSDLLPDDIEVLDLEEDNFSIPSTLTATVREPSRIGSGRKFQGMESINPPENTKSYFECGKRIETAIQSVIRTVDCADCTSKPRVISKIKFLVRGVNSKKA